MKIFLSYSLNDNEQYVLILLAEKIKQEGHTIVTSYQNTIDGNTLALIEKTHIFIGLITSESINTNKVLGEWKYALSKSTPSLLLIEDNIILNDEILEKTHNSNIVRFNKRSPETAISFVKQHINQIQGRESNNASAAWLLGGAALIVLIALLAKKK